MGLVLPASEIKWEKLKHTCILRITGEDLIVYEYTIDSRDKLLPRVTQSTREIVLHLSNKAPS